MTAGAPPRCFRIEDEGRLTLFTRVTPRAASDAVEGEQIREDGSAVLRLRVRAVPEGGKANAAAIAVIARALALPKSRIELVSGDTSRFNIFALQGEADALARRIAELASN